mgnify:CR=1 FL=1
MNRFLKQTASNILNKSQKIGTNTLLILNKGNEIKNNMVSTIKTTTLVTKWSIILTSSGIFLYGASRFIDSVSKHL